MTSRERVLKVFNHEIPDRVPRWCGASPEFIEKSRRFLGVADEEEVYLRFGDDFRRVYSRYAGPDERSPDKLLGEGHHSRTPFNIERAGIAYGQAVSHPLKEASLYDLESYPWPDPDWYDVSHIREDAAKWKGEFAILGGEWCAFWHDAMDLVGMEELFIRMYTDPDFVDELFNRITDFYCGLNRRLFAEAADVIDIFFMGNDLGSQTGPLIGLDQFEKFLATQFRKLTAVAKPYNLKVMLHCCGSYVPFMEPLMACGIDAFQALQPDTEGMEPAFLKDFIGDKAVLNGGIDSHYVLIEGTPEKAEKAVNKAMAVLKPGGNYILSASHDWLLEETPVENVLAMFDAVDRLGVY